MDTLQEPKGLARYKRKNIKSTLNKQHAKSTTNSPITKQLKTQKNS